MASSCHIGEIDNDRNRYRIWAYQNDSPCSRRQQNFLTFWKRRKIITFSHLNSTNFNNNFKITLCGKKLSQHWSYVYLSFASFTFFHHLYV